MTALLFALGCSPVPVDTNTNTNTNTNADTVDETVVSDSGQTDPPPEVTGESIGEQVMEDDWIFSHDTIHEVEITLPQASIDALYADPYTYTEAGVTFDGEAVSPVGVRLRGKIGSFRQLSGKPKFKIDFNQFISDQRFYGLETLSLNNSIVDCSYLKEHIGYALFEAAGVPASRTGVARVSVNGAPYGLYTIIEVPDDRFLTRHYTDPDGNLYDGKYVWYGEYNYTLLDFGDGVDTLFQLEEGTDVAHADVMAVSAAMAAHAGTPDWYASMGDLVDWDVLHRAWAVEQWIGQNDGYGLNTNNYRIYFDPSDGRADIIPWDLDYTFLYDWEWSRSWGSPAGNLMYYCIIDATCAAAQQAVVAEVAAAAEEAALVDLFDRLAVLIDDDARSDPRRECGESSIDAEQAEVRAWITVGSASLRSFWRW